MKVRNAKRTKQNNRGSTRTPGGKGKVAKVLDVTVRRLEEESEVGDRGELGRETSEDDDSGDEGGDTSSTGASLKSALAEVL